MDRLRGKTQRLGARRGVGNEKDRPILSIQLAALSRKGVASITSDNGAVKQKSKAGFFNIHVGESASRNEEREQLIRYCARAPLSLERLSVSADGKVVSQLKRPIRGKTHRVMDPHQFLARLCALIPPPRHPLIRFHGVFGPASKWRPEVVPQLQSPARKTLQTKPRVSTNS